ncbi:NADH-quinone oxidoreductase subunit C/D [Enterobacteriaceae endosymbiont of Donacia piscatrix]|uniref:NADH-quinone oxidoreductase subunit C/D n=1 Tax=Enterobacteriaceae endosymbiont of Donacia piscatrix TaxID=2675780 RepID=UPI0014498AA3|nr:NADH-quinone oxidoreductase subunit C/D [Enterobacteriaceae endosymbiont of Donacia piscatrix]QJC35010.1 NADH-quinone oxidoreductase subunit C/D [Enterobacteriaceae endosymbiont of Donacia piscatrix]
MNNFFNKIVTKIGNKHNKSFSKKKIEPIIDELNNKFSFKDFIIQNSFNKKMPLVIWIKSDDIIKFMKFFSQIIHNPYNMLYDMHGIDERLHLNKFYLMKKIDFSLFYHLISINRNSDIIIKIPLKKKSLHIDSITGIFKNSNWYEREIWEMFGINFINHPCLSHILLPKNWNNGYPLRKDFPSRATDLAPYILTKKKYKIDIEATKFLPEDFNISGKSKYKNYMYLNLGPNHPSVHGVFRIILQLSGEEIIKCIPEIGYHHRGAEKIAERQTWHTYIPYTDRIEYLGGCINEMPYILAVEKLANIIVNDKIKVIRIMLSELFRINSHLLYLSTFIQDIGAMTPVFLVFTDRQKIYDIIEAITGARMHPAWFRIGGLAQDLPQGWNILVKKLLIWLPKRLILYKKIALENSILISRTKNIAVYNQKEAISWGVTGAGLRATGLDFDVRKWRPYSGYENFDFDIPIGNNISDCYSRVLLKLEEIWQSLYIIKQCLNYMPEGEYKVDHPLTTPPLRKKMLNNIENLIHHFIQVSWGPLIPADESFQMIEATKGINSYYLISDGNITSYRTRIRTPSFPHLQQIPSVICGSLIPDLIAYLGSIDFVMSDVDR